MIMAATKLMMTNIRTLQEEINDTEVRDHLEKLVQLMLRWLFIINSGHNTFCHEFCRLCQGISL